MEGLTIHAGDCLQSMRAMPDGLAQTCVTSPPYFGLRDYGHAGQIGLEETPAQFVAKLVEVFREVRRVLSDDGTLWLNLGDSYANDGKWGGSTSGKHAAGLHGGTGIGRGRKTTGLKPKELMGIPWRVAFALQDDGWYLRQDIIWHKSNTMPESVRDRCTKSHEYLFLLTKSPRYYFDSEAMKEPASGLNDYAVQGGPVPGAPPQGRLRTSGNPYRKEWPVAPDSHKGKQAGSVPRKGATRKKRSVWTVATRPYKGAHFATYPPELILPCVLAGSRPGDVVLDPFGGSGTTGQVALQNGRRAVLCELNPDYVDLIRARCAEPLKPAAKPKRKAAPKPKAKVIKPAEESMNFDLFEPA